MNFEAERISMEMHTNDQKHAIDIFRINSDEWRFRELNTYMDKKKENRGRIAKKIIKEFT